MPHLTIEYSKNLEKEVDVQKLLLVAHNSLIDCPGIDMSRVKSRLHSTDRVLNQTDAHEITMIHVTLAVLVGHEIEHRKIYGRKLFDTLKSLIPKNQSETTALSVEVREMDRDFYFR